MSEYFLEPESFGRRVNVKLGFSTYAKKTESVDISKFAKKVDLANLRSDVHKLIIDELKNVPSNLTNLNSKVDKLGVDNLVSVPVDLSKLSDTVKNDVVKNIVYNAKMKNIENKTPDITNLTTETTLNSKINEVEVEIPSITNLATTAALNFKINEVKGRIPDITNLPTTTTALTTVENKYIMLVIQSKKTDYNTKINKIVKKVTDHGHDKYLTIP